MPKTSPAAAAPEKRLFISLLTRDLSLVEAFLDLIDNSVNAALVTQHIPLSDARDYMHLLTSKKKGTAHIAITASEKIITVSDTTGGISYKTAMKEAFKFGKAEHVGSANDRLSVYGIGLKRAIFKMGRDIFIESNHKNGGFTLDLNVPRWERDPSQPWTIPITKQHSRDKNYGTKIKIEQLHDDVKSRVSDSLFINELKRRISETYVYYIGRVADITVNGESIEPASLNIGRNLASDKFSKPGVSIYMVCGLGRPIGGKYLAENSGWFVFCNGRAVAYGDKSPLTGWGSLGPSFQPKHRPFLGLVFFVANDPEKLPWSTTKSSINEESLVWQEAKRRMADIGRQVTGFLDQRYTEGGTDITPEELEKTAGEEVSLFTSLRETRKTFRVTKIEKKKTVDETSIQYRVRVSAVERIKRYLGQRSMSNSEVGRYTFDYYLKNEVSKD
jgi:Histidine kinase-, DNA gyrase B-, and HSP90-like ATPase